jgi:membrane-associated PAP2 superfamily phosphatase
MLYMTRQGYVKQGATTGMAVSALFATVWPILATVATIALVVGFVGAGPYLFGKWLRGRHDSR